MKRILASFLMVTALVAGAAFVACGGGDEDKAEKTTPVVQETKESNGGEETPAAKETPSGKKTPAAKATTEQGGGEGSSGSVGEIPVYPGATKISSADFSGSDAPTGMQVTGLDSSHFEKIKIGTYETGDSSQQVLDWYKANMSGWDSVGAFTAGPVGYVSWTKDGGKVAAYVSTTPQGSKTTISVMYGTQ